LMANAVLCVALGKGSNSIKEIKMAFAFRERAAVEWLGRYRRIEGKQSVFHVRVDNTIDILQRVGFDKSRCVAEMTPALSKLAVAVNRVKLRHTGRAGGAFIINEFGQVISPVADFSEERYYVGDCSGTPVFVDPDGIRFTLDDDSDLQPGDSWDRTYVGVPYNLSKWGRVYFPMKSDIDTEALDPPQHNDDLIVSLRQIRPSGAVRFIVNPHGIVLTKVNQGGVWQPVYVGRLDYRLWFEREEP